MFIIIFNVISFHNHLGGKIRIALKKNKERKGTLKTKKKVARIIALP